MEGCEYEQEALSGLSSAVCPTDSCRSEFHSRPGWGFSRSQFQIAPTLLWFTLYALTCPAATLVTSSIDGGGQRATSASYTMDGSLGGIAGISTVASPPETLKAGYIGQLTEMSSLTVTGTPATINQGATTQLAGIATMDDATVTALTAATSPGIGHVPVQSVTAPDC